MKEKAFKSPGEIEADVCVIGSGAGGAVIAKELAEGGLSVVVLEKGERTTKYDFTQKEAEIFPRFYEDAGMRSTTDQAVTILHAKSVGGTTVFNDNICFRANEFVLREWERLGIHDISPETMARYYEKVEQEISVTRIKEIEVSRNDRVLYRGAKQMGLTPHRFFHNRKDCIGCGFCYLGCTYLRKMDMSQTYLPKAEKAGAMIFANTEAEVIERKGSRVVSILASEYDPKTKTLKGKVRVRAKWFIIAGGAISTPVLLLKNGFGRLNKNIGRHLSLHPMFANLGVLPEPIRFYEGIPQCEYVEQLNPEDGSGFILEGLTAHTILTSIVIASFGQKHRERMQDYEKFSVHYVMVKDRAQGRIHVSSCGNIRIDYPFHERDKQSMREGMKLSARLYFAAGAKKVYLAHRDAPVIEDPMQLDLVDKLRFETNRITLYSAHQFSTCRMGQNPKTSVTDSYGRVHAMENLFISDASLFPTSLGYNPQLTVMALASKNAAHLLQRVDPLPRKRNLVSE